MKEGTDIMMNSQLDATSPSTMKPKAAAISSNAAGRPKLHRRLQSNPLDVMPV